MKEFWTVFKVQLNVNIGWSALKYRFRKEKDKIMQTLMMGLALVVAVGGLLFLYTVLMLSIYSAGVMAHNPEIVLVTAILGLQLFLLVTGIFYVIGVFYYSKDLSALIPLPLKPWQVLGSKFAVVMAYEYLMALPVLVPPMIIYGIGQGVGVLYWLKALLLILVSPAMPMMLASLIAIVLMRFINIGRRKDLLAIIGGTLVTFAILAFNLLTQRIAGSATDFTKLLADQMQFINNISSAFPPSAWATLALSQNGLMSAFYLLVYIVLSAALLGLMFWLANTIYYKSAMRSEEVSRSGRSGGKNGRLVYEEATGPVRALFMRELRLLVRTPAFAMNCLIGSLIIPIIIPLSFLQGKASSKGIIALIMNPSNSMVVTFAIVGLMLFTALINVTASTALSREGKAFWMSRMIPVPPHRQVYAKFLLAMAIASAGLLLTAIMLVALLHVSIYQAVLALLLGLLGTIPVTIVNMLPDILRPKLSWTNPYEAVKQNLNVIISMLAGCVLLGIEVLMVLLLAASGLPEWAIYLIVTLVLVVLSIAGAKVLAAASKRYYKIEV